MKNSKDSKARMVEDAGASRGSKVTHRDKRINVW